MFAPSIAALLVISGAPPVQGFHLRVGITGILLIGIVLARYVMAPIALYRMSPTSFNHKLRLVADDETLDPNVRVFVEPVEAALRTVGFGEPQRIAISAQSPLTSVESLMENAATGDLVNVVAML